MKILMTMVFCLCFCQVTLAQAVKEPSPADAAQKTKSAAQIAKEEDIRKLLHLSGAGKIGVQVVEQMINVFKAQNPNVPASYWSDFRNEVNAEELVELTIPTYDKHFTHDEIKGLLKFYDSPIGKKLVQKQPIMMQEGMIVGRKWGMELGKRLQDKLKSDF